MCVPIKYKIRLLKDFFYKYCIIITVSNTKISKTIKLLDKILLSLSPGAGPDCIHLCKYWSHICSGEVIKKYWNTRFLLQIILFFSSADQKDWNVFGQGYVMVILQNLSNVFACLPCGENCFSRKCSKI